MSLLTPYLKPNKLLVIELPNEVEYIIDDEAIRDVESGKEVISLLRVVDRVRISEPLNLVLAALKSPGPIDYLNI